LRWTQDWWIVIDVSVIILGLGCQNLISVVEGLSNDSNSIQNVHVCTLLIITYLILFIWMYRIKHILYSHLIIYWVFGISKYVQVKHVQCLYKHVDKFRYRRCQKWVSDCCFTPNVQFSAISWREQDTFNEMTISALY